jgi:hypothetical protein
MSTAAIRDYRRWPGCLPQPESRRRMCPFPRARWTCWTTVAAGWALAGRCASTGRPRKSRIGDRYYELAAEDRLCRLNEAELKTRWPEITGVNLSLLAEEIPCLILAVRKIGPVISANYMRRFADWKTMEGIKMILYVEHTVDASICRWRCGGSAITSTHAGTIS